MHQTRGESTTETGGAPGVTMIDPRAPRFGQTVTMSVLLLGVGLREPLFILAVAVILNVAVFSGWRLNLYGLVWRHGMIPLVGKPEATEPASPHRFAKLMGAFMSALAAILLALAPVVSVPGVAVVGYGVAVLHAGAAAVGGLGNYCIGCRLYKQVAFFRRLGVV